MDNTSFQKYTYIWLALSLATAFFLYSHFLAFFPKDCARWLMLDSPTVQWSQLDHSPLLWFYVFLIAPLFLAGVILDKFSIKVMIYILTAGLGLSGIYFFAKINSLSDTSIIFSRIFMAAGIAFISVGYSKTIAKVMKSNRFGLMAGLFTTVALLGSICSYLPSLDQWLPYTWQQLTIICGAGVLMLLMLFSSLMQDQNQLPVLPKWNELQQAVQNPQNWLLAAFNGLALAPLIILAGVAGKPYFEQTFQYTHTQLAELGGFLLLGLGAGGPLTGYLSDRMKRRRGLMLVGIMVQEIIFVPLIYLDQTPFWLHAVFLLIFGLASSVFILSFAIAKEINSLSVIGVVTAIMNTGIISVTAMTDHLFGKILFWQWDGKIVDGIRFFSLYNFHVAFTIFPVYLLLGFILLLFVDEPAFW